MAATSKRANTGMVSNPLTRPATSKGGSVISALRARTADARTADARTVQVEEIQPNPDNPTSRSAVGEEFVASIRSVGVIQDLLLVPLEAWRRTHPQHDEQLTAAPYVALAGNRRLAGAVLAGRTEVPARIREDLDALDADSVMLHENLHRAELAPTHEALAYQRMIDLHSMSQRALAAHTGISQAQISKKLRLLALPEAVRDLVDAGLVGVETSLELLAEDDEVQAIVAGRVAEDESVVDRGSFGRFIVEARVESRRAALTAAAREQASERSAEYVDDVRGRLGARYSDQQLRTDQEIAAAQQDGTLVVSPLVGWGGDGKVGFFTTTKPAADPVSDHEAEERRNARERRKATAARTEFLRATITNRESAAQMRATVAAHALTGAGYNSDSSRVIIDLLRVGGVIGADEEAMYYDLPRRLAQLPAGEHMAAAWLVALGATEQDTRDQYLTHPGPLTVQYYDWLISRGYQPTEWEQDQLDAGRAATTQEASHE
ncbi:MAG: ParB/RepB/Spo0J family partition protein [Dermatophilaceae bacterium]